MTTNFVRAAAVLGACCALASAGSAQGLLPEHRLSATLAHEAVGEAVAACAKSGYAVTAIVVDLDGVRQAVLRGNGAPVHTLDSAYAKAYTAASLAPVRGETTSGLASLPNVTFTPGGVTIVANGKPIGGIGVGGAPGGNFDDDCARAALDKIKDRMK
jgi:uncharacterized protein GlcG (DUF336 family)